MSLQNNVLTVFKADTSQYEAAVKRMRGTEREEAKKSLDSLDSHNAKLENQLAILGKATAAIGAVTIAWHAARAAANAHLEDLRLESAAAGANIDRLRTATRGLVETDNVLAFAGKAMHGVWKLNQAEMETVAKGTDVLAKRLGMDLQTAMESVTEAVNKGTTRSLKELGIEAKDKTEALAAFAAAARDAGKGGDTAGEKWQQATVKMKDAWDDLQGAVGEFVVSLTPMVQMVASLVAHVQKFVNLLPDVPGMGGGEGEGYLSWAAKNAATLGLYGLTDFFGDEEGVSGGAWDAATGRYRQAGYGGMGVGGSILSGLGAGVQQGRRTDFSLAGVHRNDDRLVTRLFGLYNAGVEGVERAWAETAEEIEKLKQKGGGLRKKGNVADPLVALRALSTAGSAIIGAGFGVADEYQNNVNQARSDATSLREQNSTNRFQMDMAAMREDWESWYPELEREMKELRNQPTILEQIFGKPDEVTAMVVAIDAARAAVDAFGQAGAAAMGAWIDGDKSMGEAIKAVLAQSLKALAMESTVKALFHLAAAAGNAAFGNFGSAGMHLKAAGMYSAVAVAAAVGAKAAHNAGWAGGGGGGGGGGSGGAGYVGSGGGRGGYGDAGGGDRNVTIMLGRDFGMLTDLEQRQMVHGAIRRASAEDGGTSHVRFR